MEAIKEMVAFLQGVPRSLANDYGEVEYLSFCTVMDWIVISHSEFLGQNPKRQYLRIYPYLEVGLLQL